MRIIVVGAGKVGTALCRSLVEEKHDVILIEEKEEVLKRLSKRYDVMGFAGNGANFKILEQAEVSNCDVFIAMTDKDEVNMISAVLAKQMGAKETVVRVRNPEYSNAYFKDKNFLGFSLVVNPELLTARYIANTVEFPNALSVETFANGRVILMAFKVTENSQLSGMTMEQFRRKFGNILVCTIHRQGELIIPDGNATMQIGDKIYVTGKRVDMALFHSYIKPKSIKKLLLIGAGRISYYLLNILKNNRIKVKLIEQKMDRAQTFSQVFPEVSVILGDGTAKDLLLEESAASYDAVATLTGVDEENIDVAWVPGAFELPLIAKKMVNTEKYDAVICLGAVIKGSTPHFDYVCAEVSKGIASVSLQTDKPVIFGVLTTNTIEQAIERAGTKAGNKGYDAAVTAIEMANLLNCF